MGLGLLHYHSYNEDEQIRYQLGDGTSEEDIQIYFLQFTISDLIQNHITYYTSSLEDDIDFFNNNFKLYRRKKKLSKIKNPPMHQIGGFNILN